MAERSVQVTRAVAVRLQAAAIKVNRLRAIGAVRIAAIAAGATIEVDVHPTAVFEGPLRVTVAPEATGSLRIGPGAVIGEAVQVNLRGGSLHIGAHTNVRRFVTFNVGGTIDIGARGVISQGMYLHCAEGIAIGDDTIIGEHSTIADSRHLRTDVDVPIHHASTAAPIRIGRNVWMGGQVVIADGVTVADQAVVAANSVVTHDVGAWELVGGTPAKVLKVLAPEG